MLTAVAPPDRRPYGDCFGRAFSEATANYLLAHLSDGAVVASSYKVTFCTSKS